MTLFKDLHGYRELFEVYLHRLPVVLLALNIVDPELWLLVVDIPAGVLVLETNLLVDARSINFGTFKAHIVLEGLFIKSFA